MVTAEWLSGDRPESALTSDNSENTTEQSRACQPRFGRLRGGPVGPGGVLGYEVFLALDATCTVYAAGLGARCRRGVADEPTVVAWHGGGFASEVRSEKPAAKE